MDEEKLDDKDLEDETEKEVPTEENQDSKYPKHRKTLFGINQNALGFLLLLVSLGFIGFFVYVLQGSNPAFLKTFFISHKITPTPTKALPPQQIYQKPSQIPTGTKAYPTPTQHSLHIYDVKNGSYNSILRFSQQYGNFGYIEPVLQGNILYYATLNNVYAYELDTKEKQTIFTGDGKRHIMNIRASTDNKYLYISIEPTNYYSKNSTFTVAEVDLGTNQIVRVLPNLTHVFYGGIEHLYKTSDYDVIASFGGDGCGGWGTIWTYQNSTQSAVASIGLGCSTSPRLVGFDPTGNKLLLAAIIPPPKDLNTSDTQDSLERNYDVLYALDPTSKNQTPLLDLKNMKDILDIKANDDGRMIALLTKSALQLFDVKTKSITKKIPVTLNGNATVFGFHDDTVIISNYDNNSEDGKIGDPNNKSNFLSINLDPVQISKYPFLDYNTVSNAAFLGIYNNEDLFSGDEDN